MRTLVLRAVLALSATSAGTALGYDFLGSESCQSCHPDAYAAWQASPHARSRDVLSTQQRKDARCLSCHSPNEADQRTAQVACETCHGGGQYYSARFVMKDPELARLVGLVDPVEKACRACHDESSPSLKPFDFAQALKAIDHWTVERDRRKQAAAPAAPPGAEPAERAGRAEPARRPAPKRFPTFARLMPAR